MKTSKILMITLISINVRGLKNKNKRHQKYGKNNCDMVRLQETHWNERCMKEVEDEWRGEVFTNNGDGSAGGVMILTKRGVMESVRGCEDGGDGRVRGIRSECRNGGMKLVGVCVASEEKERGAMFEEMGTMCDENCMIAGDFNVWWWELDVSENMHLKNDTTREVLEGMGSMRGLSDVWRGGRSRGERVFGSAAGDLWVTGFIEHFP